MWLCDKTFVPPFQVSADVFRVMLPSYVIASYGGPFTNMVILLVPA